MTTSTPSDANGLQMTSTARSRSSRVRMNMLSRLLALSLIAASMAAVAEAKAPSVAPAFGNTIVSTYPDGRTAHLWLKEDGSYTALGRRKKPSSGRWSIKGEKICLKQQKPSAVPFNYCTPTPSGGVGTTWKAKAVTGEPIEVRVVAGVIKG
jgi:hypothetical protein